MPDTAKLSAKFQISIPKAVRNARKWKAGQEFAFIPKGTGVLLVPVPERKELAGIASDDEIWRRWLTCEWVRSFERGHCSESGHENDGCC